MKFHSAVSLVTNSSGEVFVMRKDQVPENLPEIARALFKVWYNTKADDWEKERFSPDFDPMSIVVYSELESDDGPYMGSRDYEYEHAIEMALEILAGKGGQFLFGGGSTTQDLIEGFLKKNRAIYNVARRLDVEEDRFRKVDKEAEGQDRMGIWRVHEENKRAIIQEVLGNEAMMETLREFFSFLQNVEGNWASYPSARNVMRSLEIADAYGSGELTGEVDDHIWGTGFIHFLCDTLGWTCYHNG